jgi:hypothetical protein
MLIHYIPTGKNTWDIKVGGRTKGRIEKRRGSFKSVLSAYECNRDIANDGAALSLMLHVIQAHVEDLNGVAA